MRLPAPGLALAGAIFTFFYALVFFDAPARLFRDSDTGWHIRTGERILDERRLPRTDRYSFSRPGASWFAWEWGSDLVMGATHRSWGLRGVAVVYLTAIAACSFLWFRLHRALNGDFLVACAMASPMLSTVNMHWLARPHVFGWVLLLGWLLYAAAAPRVFRGRDAVFVAALTVVWTNMHASFFLLPVTAAVLALGSRWRWFLTAAAVSLAATFVNPYGWHLHDHVARYILNGDLLRRIGEFQTFSFQVEGAAQIVFTLLLGAAGATIALLKKEWGYAALLTIFVVIALRSARGLPVLALLLPFANRAITQAIAHERFLQYGRNLWTLDRRLGGYAWAPAALLVGIVVLHAPAAAARTGFPRDEFPVEAGRAVERLPATARLFAPDKFGGYLIYRFNGERKVFFDGRSDFYGIEFLKNYIEIVQVRPGWVEEWNRWGFTHALLPVRYSLIDVLPRLGWREVHRDRTAVLFEAPAQIGQVGEAR
ncbi:MAG: hypothetical protein IT168_19275 [Bryobacterales bacterium]|nr:hypothetical protein [Bryobacterales bacterium]